MPPTIIATPGAADANSYEELVEANAYFETRVALDPAWDTADSATALLIMGTRLLDRQFSGQKTLVTAAARGVDAYYVIGRKWTGTPATSTQRLAWPRLGMIDANGNVIDEATIPQDLKDALSEFAGQLNVADRTLDSDVIVQGITAVRAGSVSVNFREIGILPHVLPQAVIDLIPPSWYTEEQVAPVMSFDLEVF